MSPSLMMGKKNDELLDWGLRTIQHNLPMIESSGLMNGKIGISLAMYHIQSLMSSNESTILGDKLINDVCENITQNLTLDFLDGLGGIGWAFEYALQQKFVEGDANELLIDFDKKFILSLVYKRANCIGLLEGMSGYGFYFLRRVGGNSAHDEHFPTLTNKHCLKETIEEIELLLKQLDYRIDEPKEFSLFWDFPVILLLLAECIAEKVCIAKATNIVEKLIVGVDKKTSLRASSKLLLSLTLKYFNLKTGILPKIDENLFDIPNSSEVKDELNGKYGINGSAGITLLYHFIFKHCREPEMKEQAICWLGYAMESLYSFRNNIEEGKHLQMSDLGLADGISGYLLVESIVKAD